LEIAQYAFGMLGECGRHLWRASFVHCFIVANFYGVYDHFAWHGIAKLGSKLENCGQGDRMAKAWVVIGRFKIFNGKLIEVARCVLVRFDGIYDHRDVVVGQNIEKA